MIFLQYVVVDFLWFRRLARGSYTDAYGFDSIDEWGRVVPDPERWPSSRGGKGFAEVARKVHAMGLKFGIHAMRGISVQAVDNNSPILDVATVSSLGSSSCVVLHLLTDKFILKLEIILWELEEPIFGYFSMGVDNTMKSDELIGVSFID